MGRLGGIACCVALVAAACSSGGSDAASTTTASGRTTTTTDVAARAVSHGGAHACDRPVPAKAVVATTVPLAGADAGTTGRTDLDITSFDGTPIFTHWFPVASATKAHPAPTVLMGPGWSLPGDTSTGGAALFGAASIGGLRAHGYNVITWDPRGFGKSGGKASVDSPDVEGRDVSAILDWVSEQPQAQLDRPGDPRVGMVGFSYGGGIQLSVAQDDCRVDALVPGLAWHSLLTSLYKADTIKSGWSNFLYDAAVSTGGHLDPDLVSSATVDLPTGTISPKHVRWYASRGPGDGIAKVDVPTLFVSGTVDTLFPLEEAIDNFTSLQSRGVPTAMLWFCGGHGTCLTRSAFKDERFATSSYAWLARYLEDDTTQEVGPTLDLVDQDGVRWTAPQYPVPQAKPVVAKGDGTLQLVEDGGSGPVTTKPPAGDLLGPLVTDITPAKAANAVDLRIDPGAVDALSVGAPTLSLTYSGTVKAGSKPERIFAQLVDDDTGIVVGNQVTPIQVTLDGARHTTRVPMEVIAQHLRPGHHLTLQLVSNTVAYDLPRLGGSIHFTEITISLPVAKGLKPAKP